MTSAEAWDVDSPGEEAWTTLVDSVVERKCTPFLGAGVAWPHLPMGGQLASELSAEFDYPLPDNTNLAKVTQYISILHQPDFARTRVRKRIAKAQDAFVQSAEGPIPANYRILTGLDLPIYITTNYDEFMQKALAAGGRIPRVEICRWKESLREELDKYSPAKPTPAQPLVFHLHGHVDSDDSILVTEDDYIDFTVSLAHRNIKTDPVIPLHVRRALSNSSLLFVGYSLADWNFRVLMRYLMRQQKLTRSDQWFSLSIQLSDSSLDPAKREKANRFLADYLGTSAIRVHWGPAGPFLEELERRVNLARETGGLP